MKIVGIEYELPLVLDLEVEIEAPSEGFSGSLSINKAWASFGEEGSSELPPTVIKALNADEDFKDHLWQRWAEEQEELQRLSQLRRAS